MSTNSLSEQGLDQQHLATEQHEEDISIQEQRRRSKRHATAVIQQCCHKASRQPSIG